MELDLTPHSRPGTQLRSNLSEHSHDPSHNDCSGKGQRTNENLTLPYLLQAPKEEALFSSGGY